MKKTILITGSTDGIGLETAKMFVLEGHQVLIHGRNKEKVEKVKEQLESLNKDTRVQSFIADLSNLNEVKELANNILEQYKKLDVLINNAGVYKVPETRTADGLDIRFMVNTIAPYLLTQLLMPLLGSASRVINLSSAAQASVSLEALQGKIQLSDGEAYAQSKLAITMWSFYLAKTLKNNPPMIVAINPASLLGSKMLKDAYGIAGKDLMIGANILYRAALLKEFSDATGKYFDNDLGEFASPHSDALDLKKCQDIVKIIQSFS